MTNNDHDIQRIYLPDPSRQDILPDGETDYINRPLATDYVFPGRGNAPHQIDNDVKTVDFKPSPNDGPIDTMPDENPYGELIPPKPVPVQIVPEPTRTILRESYMVPLWRKQTIDLTNYDNGEIIQVMQLVPYDPTREKVELFTYGFIDQYLTMTVGHYSDMRDAMVVYQGNTNISFDTQSQLFIGLMVIDNTQSGSKVSADIRAMVTTARTIDSNP